MIKHTYSGEEYMKLEVRRLKMRMFAIIVMGIALIFGALLAMILYRGIHESVPVKQTQSTMSFEISGASGIGRIIEYGK